MDLNIRYRKPERKFEGSVSGSFLGASASIGSKTGKFSQLHGFRYKSSEILLNKENADSSAEKLVEKAIEAGSRDNITAVLLFADSQGE